MSQYVKQFSDQLDLFETETTRTLLDQLFIDSKLYTSTKDYYDLLDFIVRLRNFAPFNAMLLQLQKPGLRFAASAKDWCERFGRKPKEKARPLLILWPFGPVALVYDQMDTEGEAVPEDVSSFYATGPINKLRLESFASLLSLMGIEWYPVDAGDKSAGAIRVLKRATNSKEKTLYRMYVNTNHEPPIQFVTLAHELGHLFLGHLGDDEKLNIKKRHISSHSQREIEAESVAYIVCNRNKVMSKSETYLKDFVKDHTGFGSLDLYPIMRAAGKVEAILGLTAHTKYDKPKKVVL